MPKVFLKRSTMEQFAAEAAHHANPGVDMADFTPEFQVRFNEVLAELYDQWGEGHAIAANAFPGPGHQTLKCGLVFYVDAKDFYVDTAAAGIQAAPAGLIIPR